MALLKAKKRRLNGIEGNLSISAEILKRLVLVAGIFGMLTWRFSSLETTLTPTPTFDQDDALRMAAGISSNDSTSLQNNETLEIMNEITSTLDRIIAEQAKATIDSPPQMQQQRHCAPRDGVVISNTMGRLANNLFETGFAIRLASQLCWNVLFRPHWQGEIPSPRAAECFPNAMLPKDHASLSHIPLEVQRKLKLNSTFWKSASTKEGSRAYHDWFEERQQEGTGKRIGNDASLFTGDAPNRLVREIRNKTSQTSILSLEAFFIHGDWMSGEWSDKIREWFTMSESCCHHRPPEDAVVIHLRDFGPRDKTNMGIKPAAYIHIMSHYNLTERPVWIVCQPTTVESDFVTELLDAIPHENLKIVTGQDQYDAFCTLTRAKILLLTSASSFSQMGAFLSDDAHVHYPLKTLRRPKVTLSVPGWKYHLVDDKTLDRAIRFDVGSDQIVFKAA